MAVVLRLARHGRHKRPYYRIVVANKESKRDGRYLELIGRYDPLTEPASVELKEDRIRYWIGVGAKPTDTVARFIDNAIPGYLDEIEKQRKESIRSKRSARKARNKKRVRPEKPSNKKRGAARVARQAKASAESAAAATQ